MQNQTGDAHKRSADGQRPRIDIAKFMEANSKISHKGFKEQDCLRRQTVFLWELFHDYNGGFFGKEHPRKKSNKLIKKVDKLNLCVII